MGPQHQRKHFGLAIKSMQIMMMAEIEQEIGLTLGWSKLEEFPHSQIASTCDYTNTCKTIGLIKAAMFSENKFNVEIDKEIQ
jgi:hypothetical protein